MRRDSRLSIVSLAFLIALCARTVVAQTVPVGELAGQVKDETGAALPGAGVTAASQERGYSRSTATDTSGRFRFSEALPGVYKVTVTLSGFATVTLTNNVVENSRRTDLAIVLKLSTQQAEITVSGDAPIVDKANTALESRQRSKEFEKMPVGRSYQALFLNAPGVNLAPGTNPNPSIHGALSGNNLWLYDGVDATDPTTGTFGSNLNFEAIQEVVVQTSAISAEYGRAAGGLINVITKSGTNQFAGSFKTVMTNDKWAAQNDTFNEATGASLARVKFAHLNPRYAGTLGGPFWQDHVWFFGAYESAKTAFPFATTPVSGENYQQNLKDTLWDAKVTAQITSSIQFSARGSASPQTGAIRADYGNPAEVAALTGQNQTAQQYAGFLTGVFGSNMTAEAQYNWNGPSTSSSKHYIDVFPFDPNSGAPHFSAADGFYYNGAFFDGFVNRPRQGVLGAFTYFADLGGNSHSFKAGVDYQHLESTSQFGWPQNQLYVDTSFDYRTRTFVPNQRRDYVTPVPSTSDGKIWAAYARDKFELGRHVFLELGLRYEHQNSNDDITRTTVDAGTVSPRASIAYDIFGTGKSLVVGTYGRFYQFVLQSFSDGFGQNAQKASYDNFVWDGTQYVFSTHVSGAGSSAQIPNSLKPTYNDEGTLGYRQQIGNTMGFTVTGIYRKWSNIIDDIPILAPVTGAQTVTYTNLDASTRKFWGVEAVFDKRFSENWNANVSYAYGKTTANTTSDVASSVGDYLTSNCRTTTDPTIGNGGIIPCSIVVQGPNKTGQPTLSLDHSVKAFAAYARSFGPANVALGLGSTLATGIHYQKQRTMNVLIPGCTVTPTSPASACLGGPTETYYYEPRGAQTTPMIYQIDSSLEATFTVWRTVELGVKGEVFNITDQQKAVTVNNTTWCDNTSATASGSCTAARNVFGTATARASFQVPRTFRLTALMRF